MFKPAARRKFAIFRKRPNCGARQWAAPATAAGERDAVLRIQKVANRLFKKPTKEALSALCDAEDGLIFPVMGQSRGNHLGRNPLATPLGQLLSAGRTRQTAHDLLENGSGCMDLVLCDGKECGFSGQGAECGAHIPLFGWNADIAHR